MCASLSEKEINRIDQARSEGFEKLLAAIKTIMEDRYREGCQDERQAQSDREALEFVDSPPLGSLT